MDELNDADNALRAKATVHQEELMVLRPLRHVAVGIRNDFFQLFDAITSLEGSGEGGVICWQLHNASGRRRNRRLPLQGGLINYNETFESYEHRQEDMGNVSMDFFKVCKAFSLLSPVYHSYSWDRGLGQFFALLGTL